jgi:hypothetical protein
VIARVRFTAPHAVVAALCLGLSSALAVPVRNAGVLLLAAGASDHPFRSGSGRNVR